jgi:hypothetical protein
VSSGVTVARIRKEKEGRKKERKKNISQKI